MSFVNVLLIRRSVLDYDITKGQLLVEHAYPHDALQTPTALVDVNHILEMLNSKLTKRGSWVNVIGYVQGAGETGGKRMRSGLDASSKSNTPVVQSVLVWDAGAIRPHEYEQTMEMQREAWRKTRHLHQT